MIIAIDGPAASGKSTLAKRIAAHYRLPHLDTGSLYRAVARDLTRQGKSLTDAAAGAEAARRVDPATLSDQALKAFGNAASIVAALAEVRTALLAFQRAFAGQASGAVVEGRDIGTVVCPRADAKIFITATPESRARRRHLELLDCGIETNEADVLREIVERDRRDSERRISPLRRADDALLLDTTGLDIEKAFAAALVLIDKVARPG